MRRLPHAFQQRLYDVLVAKPPRLKHTDLGHAFWHGRMCASQERRFRGLSEAPGFWASTSISSKKAAAWFAGFDTYQPDTRRNPCSTTSGTTSSSSPSGSPSEPFSEAA